MSNLSIATKEDIPSIIEMLERFHSEGEYVSIPFCRVVTTSTVDKILSDANNVIILLKKEEKHIGLLIAVSTQMMFSTKRISVELAWWIDPDYRQGREGIELLKAYEYWSKEVMKCDLCQLALHENGYVDRLTKLYERKGYKRYEQAFIKENV